MKKQYVAPEFEIVRILLNDICNGVVHTSFEDGGQNHGWGFDGDEDDDFPGD